MEIRLWWEMAVFAETERGPLGEDADWAFWVPVVIRLEYFGYSQVGWWRKKFEREAH